METWDVVRARRNVRQYTDQPIASEVLERILASWPRPPARLLAEPAALRSLTRALADPGMLAS